MDTAKDILAHARAREEARAARPRIDYDRMAREFPKQKAALDRLVKAGDREKLILHCRETIRVWDEIGCWPDDWSAWQRGLDDVFPWPSSPNLEDLRP